MPLGSSFASSVLIVDDHPIVRQGYQQLISARRELEVVGMAAGAREALEHVRSSCPDAALVDISLGDGNGIELVKDLLVVCPRLKVLVVSAHDDTLYAERALAAGALGYVNKQAATGQVVDAILTVLNDEVYVSDQVAGRLLKSRVAGGKPTGGPETESLTDRELHVYELVGHGLTTKNIATQLHLSPKTVERYKENIKQKLRIANATELVQRATRWVLDRA